MCMRYVSINKLSYVQMQDFIYWLYTSNVGPFSSGGIPNVDGVTGRSFDCTVILY